VVVRRIGILLAILLVVGHAVRSAARLPTLGTGGAAAITRMFEAAVEKGDVPGVVAAVTNRDRILYLEAFGKRDVANGARCPGTRCSASRR